MIKSLQLFIVSILFVMLSACAAKVDIPNKYLLNRMPDVVPVKRKRAVILMVAPPEIRQIYNTTQMAYTMKPFEIAYYSLNQWANVPQEMFMPLVVQTMQDTHHFKAIVTPPYNGRYDYLLATHILELVQDYSCGAPVVRMTVRAQIIKASSGSVVATRQFSAIVPLPQRTPYGGVFAANKATAHILERIAVFTLRTV